MDPLPPKQAAAAADIFQSFSYDDMAVESIEKDPELKTEPFVRVSVIKKNRQKPSVFRIGMFCFRTK